MNAPETVREVDRTHFLGGSDIAAVMGLSPWMTPLQLYEKKIAARPAPEPDDPARKKVLSRGHRWEPVALDMLLDALEERDGTRPRLIVASTREHQNRYIDKEYDFLAAEIDAEIEIGGEHVNVELKTVHPFKAHEWGEEGTEEVPIHYAAQCMHGLGITGRDRCIVGALFGADIMVPFELPRDDETIAGMRSKAVDFWVNHVLARVPPEPSNMDDIMRLFAKHNGRPVEAPPEIVEAVRNLAQLRLNQKAMDLEEEQLQFQIASYVCAQWGLWEDEAATADNAILTFGGEPIATWKKQRGQSLDQKRLKKEHPEIVSAYQREYWFRVMRPNKAQRRA